MTIAFGGLGLIAVTTGPDFDLATLALALGGALSWATGNVLVKRAQDASIFSLVVWASLVPPLPALALSALDGRSAALASALGHASWWSLGAVVYLGLAATVIAYATWGDLLRRYPAEASLRSHCWRRVPASSRRLPSSARCSRRSAMRAWR